MTMCVDLLEGGVHILYCVTRWTNMNNVHEPPLVQQSAGLILIFLDV